MVGDYDDVMYVYLRNGSFLSADPVLNQKGQKRLQTLICALTVESILKTEWSVSREPQFSCGRAGGGTSRLSPGLIASLFDALATGEYYNSWS